MENPKARSPQGGPSNRETAWCSMSQQLINHSPDLLRLREAGYDIHTESAFLIIANVPYVAPDKSVKRGALACDLTLAGDRVVQPTTHVMHFTGEFPHDQQGLPLTKISLETNTKTLTGDLVINHSFSSRPVVDGQKVMYQSYYDMVTTYVALIANEAKALDPSVTAQTFAPVVADEEESVHCYLDSASTRADIATISDKFIGLKIAIVGLGGTGSYVLDLVSKCRVAEIHLFDHDELLSHNAFRSPGAIPLDVLRDRPNKTEYFAKLYSGIHRHIVAHPVVIDEHNVAELANADSVFLCIDRGDLKEIIVLALESYGKPFIDVGMGLDVVDQQIGGIVRVTTSTASQRNHVREKNRISFHHDAEAGLYAKNIQIADLNALNAVLAVIKWKKLYGFYRDLAGEHFSAYTIDGNRLTNEDF